MARRRLLSQAAAQSLVRFGPEESALTELIRQAQANYRMQVRQAAGMSRGIRAAVRQARPRTARIYDRAGLEQARAADTLVGADLAALGPVADSIKAGAALEQTAGLRNLQEARAAALADLGSRAVAAREGAAYAKRSARDELVSELSKVMGRKQALARERGAFEAATVGDLLESAADRRATRRNNRERLSQSERNSLRSSGIDPDTGRPIPGGRLDPKGPAASRKWATDDEHQQARTMIGTGFSEAKTLKRSGASRREAAELLAAGADEQPVYDRKTGRKVFNPDGTAKKVPGLPKIEDPLMLRAALDMAYDGHLSRETQRMLHDSNYRIGRLPVLSYGAWKRRRGKSRRPPNAPAAGGMRPT